MAFSRRKALQQIIAGSAAFAAGAVVSSQNNNKPLEPVEDDISVDDLSPMAKLMVEDCPDLPPHQAQRIVNDLANKEAPLGRFLFSSAAAAVAAYRATEGPWLSSVFGTFLVSPLVTAAIPLRSVEEVEQQLVAEYGVDRKISERVAQSFLDNVRAMISASAVAATLPALFIPKLAADNT